MANTQIPQGGSAVLNFATFNNGTGNQYSITNSAGTGVANGTIGTANNGYNVTQYSSSGSTAAVTVPVSAPVGTSYRVITLVTGDNARQAYFDVVAAAAAAPLVPAGVTAKAKGGLQVVLDAANKAAQPSGTTYNLFSATVSGGEGTTPIVSGIASLPYTRQEAAAGVKYYTLQAVNGGTASGQSGEAGALVYDTAAGTFRIQSLRSPRIAPGATETFPMNVEANDGYATPIALSLACTGQGITGSFLGAAGLGSFAAGVATGDTNNFSECLLSLSASLGTAPGTYPFTVTATSGGQTLTMQANVEVSASAGSDASDGRGA